VSGTATGENEGKNVYPVKIAVEITGIGSSQDIRSTNKHS